MLPKNSTQERSNRMSPEPSCPRTPDVRSNVFSMIRLVPKRETTAGLYLVKRLATDSACASDTPSMPKKWNTVKIASHKPPGGRNRAFVRTYFHQDVHEKDRPSWKIGPATGQGHGGNHAFRAISGMLSKRAHIRMRPLYWANIILGSSQVYISIRFAT